MSILTDDQKDIIRLYEALKRLVERRRAVGSNLNQGLASTDGRYQQAEEALIESRKGAYVAYELSGRDYELYRR